jgi:hypothetical protein
VPVIRTAAAGGGTNAPTLKNVASAKFWALYAELPAEVTAAADKNYAFLKDNQ